MSKVFVPVPDKVAEYAGPFEGSTVVVVTVLPPDTILISTGFV